MKDGAKEIVGKQIVGVYVAESESRAPFHQVFLAFSDNTYFEIYGDQFNVAGGVDQGGANVIANYIKAGGGNIEATYEKPKDLPRPAKDEGKVPTRVGKIEEFWTLWMLGFKYACGIGLIVIPSLFGGALAAAPFILVAEIFGYKIDEEVWLGAGILVCSPCLLGAAFPSLQKFVEEWR